MRRLCYSLFALVLVGGPLPSAHAAGDWPIPRGPSHELVPYRYDPQQWQKVPRKFLEDAPACTLYAGITHLVEPDGTVETITHEITRLSSRKALDKLGEYRAISYTPAYEKLTLNEARVLKADGRIVQVEAKHVHLRDVDTDFQVYDTSKQLVISFPSLEVGDSIEVKWSVRGKNPEHGGQVFNRYTFGDDRYPVVCDELRLRLPKAKPLKHATVSGSLQPEIKEESDSRTYLWRVTNRPQLPQDENLPSKEELRLQVVYSTFASWNEVFEWKRKLRRDCWTCTEDIRKIVRNITKDRKTPQEKAAALTYWVRRHIRYISTGEKHDFTPHTPAWVLDNRFGDCKDSTQLLAVMLREAGISVGLATLGVLDDGQVLEAVPSPWGTHAILRVRIDGKDHWIDTTASLAAWDFLPKDDRGRLCYVTDDKGLSLVRTPPIRPEENRTDQTTYLSIGADGSSRAERIAVYHGNAAHVRRQDWVEVPIGERRRLLTAELQDAHSQCRLAGLKLDEAELRDYSAPVRARIVFEIAGHFAGDPDLEGTITDSPVWGKLLAYTVDFERTLPLELGTPFESIHRYVIQAPPAYHLETSALDKEIASPWGVFRLKVNREGRRLEIEYHTRLEKVRVEPVDFEAFRQFHDRLSRAYRVWLTFKPDHDQEDAPILEAVLGLTPGDRHTAAILANLYLRHDKKPAARRVLQGARYYHPENAALAELAVQAAATVKEEEAIYRELVRRFPDEQKYAVALGRALIEAGKMAPARAILRRIVKDGTATETAQAHYQLARSFLLVDKAGTALKQWKAATDADESVTHTAAGMRLKGRIHERLDQTKEAILAYQEALSRSEVEASEDLDALVRLSLAAKEPAEALKFLRRYTVAVDGDPDGLAKAADYHLRLGRRDDAIELAARSIQEKDNSLARRTQGLVRFYRGECAEAAADLDKADLDADVLAGRVRCQLALGRLSGAIKWAEQADKAGAPTPELLRAIALTLRLTQRRKVVASELRMPPDQVEKWDAAIDRFVCAEHAYLTARPIAQVESLLGPIFADQVEIGSAYALRGLLALEKGRLTRALPDAEKAIALAPKDSRGFYVRGRVRLERANAQALADLVQAAALSRRKDPSVLHWLAAAQNQAGQKADALATQREAVKLKPNDKEFVKQLRELEK